MSPSFEYTSGCDAKPTPNGVVVHIKSASNK
jgi:hypothetical protein